MSDNYVGMNQVIDKHGEGCRMAVIEAYSLGKSEVDEWHPASEPPKPEDFEPTGCVHVISEGFSYFLTPGIIHQYQDWTHWRKITPPKP